VISNEELWRRIGETEISIQIETEMDLDRTYTEERE
jgi:hypothetical protein